MPDCASCTVRPLESLALLNAEAVAVWQTLDVYGRELDMFGGCPMPLRLEAVSEACGSCCDPDGIRWRVLLIEELVYVKRIERHKAKQEREKR